MVRISESERFAHYKHSVKKLLEELHDSKFEDALGEAAQAAREVEHFRIEIIRVRSEGRVAHARRDLHTLSLLKKSKSEMERNARSANRRYNDRRRRLKMLKKRFLDPYLNVICRMRF